jgi:hypothetical protein
MPTTFNSQKKLNNFVSKFSSAAPILDVRGLILGMLVTFSYAQVAMYIFGLCDIPLPITKEVR